MSALQARALIRPWVQGVRPREQVAACTEDDLAEADRRLRSGEAAATPALAPQGGRAVWVQGENLLVWEDGSFRTAPHPTGSAQVVTVDDSARAIWNQVTVNTRGDLVAVGSLDRQHVTAQRYDRPRRRWTQSRVVYVADAPTCRRSPADSGVLQGSTFRLRLLCDGRPVVLRSRTGVTWSGRGVPGLGGF